MIILLGSNYDGVTDVYHFYYHNSETNWYYEMACRNSFGTADMNSRTKDISMEEFKQLAGDRLA